MREAGKRKDDPMTKDSLSIQLILDITSNLGGLIISLVLTVRLLHKKNKQKEQAMFFRMCLVCLFISLIMAVANASLFFPASTASLYFICQPLAMILTFLLVAQWLVFVDYTLHQSMDLIRRRYPVMRIPFFLAIIMEVIYSIIALPMIVNDKLRVVMGVLSVLEGVILAIFAVGAYLVLLWEMRRTPVPQYIKVTPTIICFAVVIIIIAGQLQQYGVLTLFCALGMAFAYYYMYRRFSFQDEKTGFYTEKYLPEFYKTLHRKQLRGGTVIRFQVPESNAEKTAAVLKSWMPEGRTVVTPKNGVFLILSDPMKNVAANQLIAYIDAQLKEEGISAETGFTTNTDEPAEVFFRSALQVS